MIKKWLTQTASDLGRGIAAQEIDPVELADTYLKAIKQHEFADRIYARLTEDRAFAEAEAAKKRAKSGHRLGLLDGVPISWKDLFEANGTATEAGSALLKDSISATDAKVLQNATSAGLLCLGKTHMSELAFSGLGLNPMTATPPCVNDIDAVSGGSSSGAAASVAFDLAPAGIGSDTGGSVRIPAAWNDLVGLKTTAGRLSLDGVVPLCKKFDTVGPLCRSVEDANHLFASLAGQAVADLGGATLEGRRFAICITVAMDDVDPVVRKAFDDSVVRLKDAGAIIDEIAFPEVVQALDMAGLLYTTEAYAQWGQIIEQSPDVMYPEILERFRAGRVYSGEQYLRGWNTLETLRKEFQGNAQEYDAVIMPCSPILPPNMDKLLSNHDYYVRANLLALRNTRIGNLMGLASLTLPTATASCGFMLNGPPNSEVNLLRLGSAIEVVFRA